MPGSNVGKIVKRPPTEAEEKLEKTLDALLGEDGKHRYVAIVRRDTDKPGIGSYILFGNVEDEEGVMIHLMNFIDGMLSDENFAQWASALSSRAMDRMGLEFPGKPKPKAN